MTDITTTSRAEVYGFLLGENPLDNVWFGEKHPTEKGQYWWRKHLRAALTSAPSVPYETYRAALKAINFAIEQDERASLFLIDWRTNNLSEWPEFATPKPAPSVPDGWQLAEKAPHGSNIIAYSTYYGHLIVVLDGAVDKDGRFLGRKFFTGHRAGMVEAVDDITHWMPLPAAPKPKEKK